ncbi:MAG: TAT-variant-translocated molybdopterin oxidoreductase, partial [Opitutales bacterium]
MGRSPPHELHGLPSMKDTNGNDSDPTGPRYWKSLDDLAEMPAFRSWLEREFPEEASMLDGVQRRGFMKVMAASFGLAGLGITGCRRPEQAIMPYGRSPEEIIPGIPNYYSTSIPSPHGNIPIIVESHQSRPTKIEGNSSYAPGGGTTNVHAQASVLDLYDPDRAQGSYSRKVSGKTVSWKKLSKAQVAEKLGALIPAKSDESQTETETEEQREGGGTKGDKEKVAFLAGKSSSPARAKLAAKLQEKGAIWAEYEAIDLSAPEKVLAKALGAESGLRPLPQLAKAKRILSLDC